MDVWFITYQKLLCCFLVCIMMVITQQLLCSYTPSYSVPMTQRTVDQFAIHVRTVNRVKCFGERQIRDSY